MKYESIPIDDSTGRLVKCLKCENEEIDGNANFCKICGTEILNICTNDNCKSICSGNARFCVKCGSETSFYKNKILKSWSDIKGSVDNTKYVNKSEEIYKREIPHNVETIRPNKISHKNNHFEQEVNTKKQVAYKQVPSLDDDDDIPFSRIKI